MTLPYGEIGERLKAFRHASGLSMDQIARRIGISRTALYRFEKGGVAKIETLEKLSELLQVSMPTLLGVGIEYLPSAVGYFERVRQLEARADQIVAIAGPISLLLASDAFCQALGQVLRESVSDEAAERQRALADVEVIVDILHARRRAFQRRRVGVVNLVSPLQIERFLGNGLMGRAELPRAVRAERQAMAREEMERFAALMENEDIGVQIGVVEDSLPYNGFQLFRQAERMTLATSPFRLSEQTNVRMGIAMVTSAPEAIALHQDIVKQAWRNAAKGPAAAARVRELLARRQACQAQGYGQGPGVGSSLLAGLAPLQAAGHFAAPAAPAPQSSPAGSRAARCPGRSPAART